MGSNNHSDSFLPANQVYGAQENQTREIQEGTIPSRRSTRHRTQETGDAHGSNDAKTSSSRSETGLDLNKSSVGIRQESRKPAARPNKPEHNLSANSRHRGLDDESAKLKTQLEVTQHDLAQSTKQSGEMYRRVQKLQGEREDLLATIKVERTDWLREKTKAENQIRDLHGTNQKLEDELKMLKGALRGVQEKQLQTTKLLEERTADLKGAQTFLTTVDRYAGADIMKMVVALNAEIFQGAALISELLGDENTTLKVDEKRKDSAKSIQAAKDGLAPHIGLELFEHLSTNSKQVQLDPLPLQLAVQAILTSWCVFMVGRFHAGPSGDDLGEIYRRIWESGKRSWSEIA